MPDKPDPPDIDVSIPSPQGLRVTVEDHPYHVLVVGNFAGTETGSLSGDLNDGVVAVSANSFAELLQSARPSMCLKTTDPLASGNVMVAVDLEFDSLKAFEPTNLLSRLPTTKTLSTLREKLVERLRGKISSDAVTKAVNSAIAAEDGLASLVESLKWAPKQPTVEADVVAAERRNRPDRTAIGDLPGVACRRQHDNADSQKRREPAARPNRVAVETNQLQESPLFEAPC